MPFKSEAQHRKFRAMVAEGAMPKKTLDKMMDETKKKNPNSDTPIKDLPEKVAGKKEDVVIDFLSKNKNPKNKDFHENAKKHGINEHKAEETAYSMLGSFIDSVRTKEASDKIKGGLADHMKASGFDKGQLNKGVKVEKEHTKDPVLAKEIAMDHLDEHPKYYSALEKMEKNLEKRAFFRGFSKVAGGPGSGVTGDNAKKIDDMLDLETSPIVTIGKRKEFMDNRSPDREKLAVLVEKIKYKGQEKYVPAKLKKFMDAIKRGETWMWDKPVQLLRDSNDDFHILDGHHRVLAAILSGRTLMAADVYTDNVKFKETSTLKKSASLEELFTRGKPDIEENSNINYLWGLNPPKKGVKAKKERVDLVDINKPDDLQGYSLE